MAKKLDTEIISVRNVRRAHRRDLPKVLTQINKKLRRGYRTFSVLSDFPDGMFPYVVSAFEKQPGWYVVTNAKYGRITVWLPGERLENIAT
jgi:hypothetical protein